MPRITIAAIAALFASCALVAPAWAEEVEHPIYKSWAKHEVGTTITLRAVTGSGGQEIETTTEQTLVQVTEEKVVLEVLYTSNATGTSVVNAPQTHVYKRMFPVLPVMKKEDIGKPSGRIASGEETVTIAGKAYKAQWYDAKGTTEAGPSRTRTWMSDDVPGKLLRSVTKVEAADKTTTLELVEIKSP